MALCEEVAADAAHFVVVQVPKLDNRWRLRCVCFCKVNITWNAAARVCIIQAKV